LDAEEPRARRVVPSPLSRRPDLDHRSSAGGGPAGGCAEEPGSARRLTGGNAGGASALGEVLPRGGRGHHRGWARAFRTCRASTVPAVRSRLPAVPARRNTVGAPPRTGLRDRREGKQARSRRNASLSLTRRSSLGPKEVTMTKVRVSTLIALGVLTVAAGALAAPATNATNPPTAATQSLYERLGGAYAIATVVDDFIERLLVNDTLNANPAIKEARGRVPKAGLKFHVTTLVCQVTGGPCKYVGRDMKTSHAHLNIREGEWNAMGTASGKTLDKSRGPAAEQGELIAIVGSTKAEIVVGTAATGN